jgi:hypothetical protein
VGVPDVEFPWRFKPRDPDRPFHEAFELGTAEARGGKGDVFVEKTPAQRQVAQGCSAQEASLCNVDEPAAVARSFEEAVGDHRTQLVGGNRPVGRPTANPGLLFVSPDLFDPRQGIPICIR